MDPLLIPSSPSPHLPLGYTAGLGEHKIRDLNDEINRLMREKHQWEKRIKELGGVDYYVSLSRFREFCSLLFGQCFIRYSFRLFPKR
jgi:hypothetical protein